MYYWLQYVLLITYMYYWLHVCTTDCMYVCMYWLYVCIVYMYVLQIAFICTTDCMYTDCIYVLQIVCILIVYIYYGLHVCIFIYLHPNFHACINNLCAGIADCTHVCTTEGIYVIIMQYKLYRALKHEHLMSGIYPLKMEKPVKVLLRYECCYVTSSDTQSEMLCCRVSCNQKSERNILNILYYWHCNSNQLFPRVLKRSSVFMAICMHVFAALE